MNCRHRYASTRKYRTSLQQRNCTDTTKTEIYCHGCSKWNNLFSRRTEITCSRSQSLLNRNWRSWRWQHLNYFTKYSVSYWYETGLIWSQKEVLNTWESYNFVIYNHENSNDKVILFSYDSMSSFDQFSTKKKSSSALVNLFKETFLVGMDEMSKNLSTLFWSPSTASKQQISPELERRENQLKQARKI